MVPRLVSFCHNISLYVRLLTGNSGEENKTFCIYLTNRVDYPSVTELVLRYAVMGRDEVTIPPPGPMDVPLKYVMPDILRSRHSVNYLF